MKRLLILASLIFSSCSIANEFKLDGFTETVFIVSDIDKTAQFYVDYAGWELRSSIPVDDQLKTLWQLPKHAKVTQKLLANKGENRGFIRLIHIENVPQQLIRANTQSWDVGGIFDVNMRVIDMQKKSAELQSLGWRGTSDAVSFTFGPYEVKEWLATGHDGVTLAMIERVKPTLKGWPNLKQMSRVFNATQIVSDIDKSLWFYQDVLGFQIYLKHKGASKEQGPNVLGLPYNLTTEIERSVYILHPDKINEGSVEILQFHGAKGKDVRELASPPNLGIVTLRFPVDNILALEANLVKHNIEIVSKVTLNLPPYGIVDMLAIRTPDNTWLEFYQINLNSG